MTAPLILVVEDEPTIANAIARRLAAESYRVVTASDGLEAVTKAAELQPDLLVLDVMLPSIDGLEVCRRVQADRPVPVLMLTARDDETDKLVGLGVGADDYMTKPFSMRELLARIKALLRRVERAKQLSLPPADASPIVTADLVIDRASRRVTRAGREVHLTPTEFDLLVFLAESPRTVLTREKLLEHVWDWIDASGTRTVDSHIKAVRRKLGADLIRTVHGVGYAFDPAPAEPAANPNPGPNPGPVQQTGRPGRGPAEPPSQNPSTGRLRPPVGRGGQAAAAPTSKPAPNQDGPVQPAKTAASSRGKPPGQTKGGVLPGGGLGRGGRLRPGRG